MAKIAIVATFYQRQMQLDKTLASIAKTNHKDFELIIVDDCSPDEITLPDLPYDVTVLRLINKTWANTASVYNMGFIEALKRNPDIVILQNAECYHHGDILTYAEKNLTDENYIAFGCYSLAKDEEPGTIANDRTAIFDGDSAWYNHPVHRPLAYHFCAAITTKNLVKINGFDERFCPGIAYEDDYMVHQIRNLGLRIDIPIDPIVFHQYHYDGMARDVSLTKRNAELWEQLKTDNNFRAVHVLTPDL
jgi:glycosyltransferase involved in cell wall biosynthesis